VRTMRNIYADPTATYVLIGLNVLPKPVALTPVVLSSPTTGVGVTGGLQPPPQRLNPTINPASGLRGVY